MVVSLYFGGKNHVSTGQNGDLLSSPEKPHEVFLNQPPRWETHRGLRQGHLPLPQYQAAWIASLERILCRGNWSLAVQGLPIGVLFGKPGPSSFKPNQSKSKPMLPTWENVGWLF